MELKKSPAKQRRKSGTTGQDFEIEIIPSPVPSDASLQANKKSLFTRLIANMVVSAMLAEAGDTAGAERVWEDSE